jgi:hypothetical protein
MGDWEEAATRTRLMGTAEHSHGAAICDTCDLCNALQALDRLRAERDEMFTATVVDEVVAAETEKLREELTRLRGTLQSLGRYIHALLDHDGDWEVCGSTSCSEAAAVAGWEL